MTFLADTTARMSLIVLASLGLAAALKHRSAALRHWVLAIGLACAAGVPVLQVALPEWRPANMPLLRSDTRQAAVVSTEVVVPRAQTAPGHAAAAQPADRPYRGSFPWWIVLTGAWLAGAVGGVSMLVAGLWRLSKLASAARPLAAGPLTRAAFDIEQAMGVRRPVALLQSSDPSTLMTWGVIRPTIVLPAGATNWSGELARVVLRHELAHIARRDWPAQMLAETLSAIYWFNPLLWMACGRLRSESERACDDAVLTSGVDAARYASHLLGLARSVHAARPVLGMARSSGLEGRVAAMLNRDINRRPLRNLTRLAIVLAFAALTVPLALAQGRFSTFSGAVVDQTNRFVPDAVLVLTNVSTEAKYEVKTDRAGHFQFVGLPPGEYQLEARHAGFKTYKSTVSVADKDVARTIQLPIGAVHETLHVTGGLPNAVTSTEQRQATAETSRLRVEDARRARAEKCSGDAAAQQAGGRILAPLKLVDVKPVYPDTLRTAGIGGIVTLDAVIGTDGTVRDIAVVSSPNPELDRLASDAVRQWQFTTTYLNCTPVEVPMRVTVDFAPK